MSMQMSIQRFQKIKLIDCYLLLCFKVIQTSKIMCDMEIFANYQHYLQISSVPYFADFVSLRNQTKDLKQNCLFAVCFSRQNHYSILVRDVIIFSLQNTYKNHKGRLKSPPHRDNSNPNQLHTYQFSLILNNLN